MKPRAATVPRPPPPRPSTPAPAVRVRFAEQDNPAAIAAIDQLFDRLLGPRRGSQ